MMENPKVVIDNEVFRKIMHWVNKSEYEVSGLGTLVLEPEGIFRVKSAMLLPQKNGSTHTDIEPEDVGKLMFALKDEPGELRFWWHSHVNMPVFWSGTDMDTIRKLGQGGWFLSTVFNKKRELRSAFYAVQGINSPWGAQALFQDELDTKIEPFTEAIHAVWDEEYETNVINIQRVTSYGKIGDYGDYWDKEDGWQFNRGGPYIPSSVMDNRGMHVTPPAHPSGRPQGISKREWKKMRREASRPTIVQPDDTDTYGFTQEERTFLAQMGWDQGDIDDAIEHDITPIEMLQLAEADILMTDIEEMITQGWTIGDVLKHFAENYVPVMDRRNGAIHEAD